jgi:hypothetical protein
MIFRKLIIRVIKKRCEQFRSCTVLDTVDTGKCTARENILIDRIHIVGYVKCGRICFCEGWNNINIQIILSE